MVGDLRSRSRIIRPSLLLRDEKVGHGQRMGREFECRILGVFFPVIVGEAASIVTRNPVVPNIYEVEEAQRDGFNTDKCFIFAKMMVEVDEVNDLTNMDSGVKVVMFTTSFIMSSLDAIERGMFDAGRIGHGEIELEVDSEASERRGKEGTKMILKRMKNTS